VAEEAGRGGAVTAPTPERSPRPRGFLRALRREQGGTAMVEFALVAPLLFGLLIAILDFGQALNYYNQQTQLVGLGARAAVVSRCPDGTALGTGCTTIQQQLVDTYATGAIKNNTNICIQSVAPVGQPVTVTASYDFRMVPFNVLGIGIPGTITIEASQSERQEAPPTYTAGCQS
jgi:Flp pilus assembly protein TadG